MPGGSGGRRAAAIVFNYIVNYSTWLVNLFRPAPGPGEPRRGEKFAPGRPRPDRVPSHQGWPDEADELRHLRARYFADEAPTIEREEGGGFFRFERPRVYGRN